MGGRINDKQKRKNDHNQSDLVILWPILLWEGDVQSRLAMYLSVFIITLCTSLGSTFSFSDLPLCLYLYLMYLSGFIFYLSYVPPQVHLYLFSCEPPLRLYAILTAPTFCLMHNEQTLTVGAHKRYKDLWHNEHIYIALM